MINPIRKVISIFYLLLLSNIVVSQSFNNKINIFCGYHHEFVLGEDLSKENGFIYPNLFTNYAETPGFIIKGSYRVKPYLHLGVGYERIYYSTWQLLTHDTYDQSEARSNAFYPIIQVNTPYRGKGFFNSVKFKFQFNPHVGKVNLKLSKAIFEIEGPGGQSLSSPLNSNELIWGFESLIGFELIAEWNFGLFSNFGYRISWINPSFYDDVSIKSVFIESGLFFKLWKDKTSY